MSRRWLQGAAQYKRLAAPAAAVIAHGLRMTVNLIVIKFIAVAMGPAGLGMLGNLMSATTMVALFSGGGILNGITKYVAEYNSRPDRLRQFLQGAAAYGFSASIIILLISFIAARPLSLALFGTNDMAWLIPILGIAHLLCFIGNAIIAIINGKQQPFYFALITGTGYLSIIPIAFLLIKFGGMSGAAIALVGVIVSTAIPAVVVGARNGLISMLRPRFHSEDSKRLFRFTCIAIVSAAAFPLTEILIRTHLAGHLGVESTGIWQAMTRLSGAILGFFTVYLATSHMPRLSAISDNKEAAKAVVHALSVIGPAFACCALLIYLMRSIIVPLLFSSSFGPLEEIIGWQLIGDLLRVCSYVVSFLVVAKAALKMHIIGELTQCVLYLGFALGAVRMGFGLQEVAQAYALTYAIYFVLTLLALKRYATR
ncbi:hypothetical protein ASE06_07730 [Sphingopyxis sp. Root214]|jgi:PST family polysaccharide transporter/antigen flippase|uniref:O-antigen translocase n=1 Tax=unclassified Sphingopyxis TaxID=2614943 RepID=UPI000700D8AF|nr:MULTISPECIES: O-antigen translocase [unclassified Sphingopyxis]KQZ76408.1 hypothetical protein ASD73_00260 [Sphingopyxis sp. Root154]KRC09704.1 hypothetical protein ASE06_07730 [Sphingopyxis sp. Root214]